uniref:ATPase AAA-type core domain-containing protein n=1 Tax=Oryza glaberrima TaxID=4538 RepID=I1R2R7_ORYGL
MLLFYRMIHAPLKNHLSTQCLKAAYNLSKQDEKKTSDIGAHAQFQWLMHEIMQTPKSAINADQDYLGMFRDILHTPVGFENSMIMTSNRFPENYEQMGGETEQGTQVICDQWASKNIEELYNINMNNQQGLSSVIKTLASRWSRKDIDELYNINNTHQVVNGSTSEVENNVSASELENNGTTSNNQDDEDSENQYTWAFESNNETAEGQ